MPGRADRTLSTGRLRRSQEAVADRALVRAAQRGNRGARERLAVSHLPLIRSVARRFRDLGLPLDDLVQEGALGLLEAIDRYEPNRRCEFDSFARLSIRRAICAALTDQARLVRLPKHVVERRRALNRIEADLAAAGGRTPTMVELAAAADLSEAEVLEARDAAVTPVSLDELAALDGGTLESLVADPNAAEGEAEAISAEKDRLVRGAVAALRPRRRAVVSRHFGFGSEAASLREVAAELHVSERRARAIENEALSDLESELEPVLKVE